ncbi:hypothetical protein [Plantactinospora mayteni]|uniref:hypothetical protein n=1 Tax=Plantactinospora mayteni TaxID=566021 RepID=UPI001941C16F|nr:hypothetical protein [Plantactinospora mayteni]
MMSLGGGDGSLLGGALARTRALATPFWIAAAATTLIATAKRSLKVMAGSSPVAAVGAASSSGGVGLRKPVASSRWQT